MSIHNIINSSQMANARSNNNRNNSKRYKEEEAREDWLTGKIAQRLFIQIVIIERDTELINIVQRERHHRYQLIDYWLGVLQNLCTAGNK